MDYASNPVKVRLAWCRQQKAKARTGTELEGWHAEEEGLKDALLSRNHTTEYRQTPPEVFERYMLGLQDGQALLRAAWVDWNYSFCHRREAAPAFSDRTGSPIRR